MATSSRTPRRLSTSADWQQAGAAGESAGGEVQESASLGLRRRLQLHQQQQQQQQQQQKQKQCCEEIELLQREKQQEIDMADNTEWREQLRRELEAEISRRVREALDTPPAERQRRSRELARLKAASQKERELTQLRLAAGSGTAGGVGQLRFYGDQQLLRRTTTDAGGGGVGAGGFRALPAAPSAGDPPASASDRVVHRRSHGFHGNRSALDADDFDDEDSEEDADADDAVDAATSSGWGPLPLISASRQLTCLAQPQPPQTSPLRQGLEAMRQFGDLSPEERALLFSNFTRDGFRRATAGGGGARLPDGSALVPQADGRYRDQYGILRESHGPFWPSDFGPCHPAPRHRRLPSPKVEPLLLPMRIPGCEPAVTADTQRTDFTGRWRGTQIVYDSERCPRHYAPPAVAEDVCPSLVFESRFESGNLRQVRRVGMFEYELVLRTDLYTKRHTQWFYFKVQNAQPRTLYKFVIVNLLKPSSLYAEGMKPLLYSEKVAAVDGLGWHRAGHHIRYSRNVTRLQSMLLHREMAYYQLEWQMDFPHVEDACYLAHCYPYTYSDLREDLLAIQRDPRRRQLVREEVLCETRAGNSCLLLTVTEPGEEADGCEKSGVVVTARVHPGEANSSWMMKGLIDFLTGDSQTAAALRRHFVFKLVPMLNPDGVIVGNYRTSLAGRDLNRNYRHPRKETFPTVYHTKLMLERLQRERRVLLYCDLHGHSRKPNVFMYGCDTQYRGVEAEQVNSVKLHLNPAGFLNERLFPWLVSRCAPQLFSYRGCKFNIRRCKEATGRVVVWRQFGIENSFTMEATFSGTSATASESRHFNTADLETMGHSLAGALWQYKQVKEDTGRQAKIVVDMTFDLVMGLLRDRGAVGADREATTVTAGSVRDSAADPSLPEQGSLLDVLRAALGGKPADLTCAEARRSLSRLNPGRLMDRLALTSVDDCSSVLKQLNIDCVDESDSSDSDSESEPELPAPPPEPAKKPRKRKLRKKEPGGKKRDAKEADRRKVNRSNNRRVSFSSVIQECQLDQAAPSDECWLQQQTEENETNTTGEDQSSAARKPTGTKSAADEASCAASGRAKIKQFPMFVSKFEGRTNNGIPCFSEERLLERANRKIYSLHSRLNQERGRDIIYSQHVEEIPRDANASLASLEEIRYRLQHLLASQDDPEDDNNNDATDSDETQEPQPRHQHPSQPHHPQGLQQNFTVVRPAQSLRPAAILQRRRSLSQFNRVSQLGLAGATSSPPSLERSLPSQLLQQPLHLVPADQSAPAHESAATVRSRVFRLPQLRERHNRML